MKRLAELSENQKDRVVVICWMILIGFLFTLFTPTEWLGMYHTAQRFFNFARY